MGRGAPPPWQRAADSLGGGRITGCFARSRSGFQGEFFRVGFLQRVAECWQPWTFSAMLFVLADLAAARASIT